MKDKILFILLQNYSDINIWWNYFLNEKKNNLPNTFLKELQNIGDVYLWDNKFSNLNYYCDNSKEKNLDKLYDKLKIRNDNINFKLDDININKISIDIYNNVKQKYNEHKFIVIGHGLSGLIAKYFSELYYNDCLLCVCMNSTHYNYDFIKELNKIIFKDVQNFNNEAGLNKLLSNVKKNEKNRNDEIDKIFDLIEYKLINDILNNYNQQFKTFTLFIRGFFSKPKDNYESIYNKETDNEIKFLKKYNEKKFDYLLCDNSDFYIWQDYSYFNEIIKKIKSYIELNYLSKIKRTKKNKSKKNKSKKKIY